MDTLTLNIAADGIRKAGSFQDMAEWFASAFDTGPAGGFDGIADTARNIDAIHTLGQRLKQAWATYADEAADIEDRISATQEINRITAGYRVQLPGGGSVNARTFEIITGAKFDSAKPLMSGNDYSDMKLTQFRDKAKAVADSAGVDPAAVVQKIQDLENDISIATIKLNAKTGPICEAWQTKFYDALESTGYNAKKKESLSIIDKFSSKRNFFLANRPNNRPGYLASQEEHDAFSSTWNEWQKALDEHDAERQKLLAPLQAEMLALYDKANAMAGDLNTEIMPFNQAHNELVAKKREEIAEAKAFAGKLKDHVLSSSPVSQEAADKWFADMVLIPKNMKANLKKRGYTPEKLKQDMTEFYRMTGGRLARISFDTKGGQRAAAQPTTGVVYVAGSFSKQTLFHELAHVLEDDERTRSVANRFLDHRTGRTEEGKNKVVSLAALTGNRNYKSSEVAYKDSFIDPYVGKHYRDGKVTEVFSMGMQYFNSPESMAVLCEKDPDHFNFMLGYMTTLPRLDIAKVEQQQAAMANQKDTLQTTEGFLKTIDKKIAKAGDFWTSEGFEINYYGKSYTASWPSTKEGYSESSYFVKGEKNIKRAMWLNIAAGKPKEGPYSMRSLTGNVFNQKTIEIPKDMAENQMLIEGPQGAAQ